MLYFGNIFDCTLDMLVQSCACCLGLLSVGYVSPKWYVLCDTWILPWYMWIYMLKCYIGLWPECLTCCAWMRASTWILPVMLGWFLNVNEWWAHLSWLRTMNPACHVGMIPACTGPDAITMWYLNIIYGFHVLLLNMWLCDCV